MTYLRVGPLVRATNATSAVLWAELPYSCTVLLSAQPSRIHNSLQAQPMSIRTHTITLGGRFYIAPQLQGLLPATWYTYWISIVTPTEHGEHKERLDEPFVFCFRTMEDESDTPSAIAKPLRLVYGSCRKFVAPQTDALSGFGRWLRTYEEQKENLWPHLLLLIGDQIYADQPSHEVKQQSPQLHAGAKTFEDFALLYEYAWTRDSDVRQVLSWLRFRRK